MLIMMIPSLVRSLLLPLNLEWVAVVQAVAALDDEQGLIHRNVFFRSRVFQAEYLDTILRAITDAEEGAELACLADLLVAMLGVFLDLHLVRDDDQRRILGFHDSRRGNGLS